MYKKRIKDWKLGKNFKALEKEEILRLVEANKQSGIDLGDPMLNGRTVKMHVIERHRNEKRKVKPPSTNVNLPSISAAKRFSDTEKLFDCCTMASSDARSAKRARLRGPTCSASITFSRIGDPSEYREFENLLFQIDQYFSSKLGHNPRAAWDAWEESVYSQSRPVRISYTFQGGTFDCTFRKPSDVFNRFSSAEISLREHLYADAWRLTEEGAELVRPMLQQEHPSFLAILLSYSSQQTSDKYAAVQDQLFHLFSSMAAVVLGERHPVSNVCRLLRTLRGRNIVIETGLRKIRDVLNHCLGQDHTSSVQTQQLICDCLIHQKKYDEAERFLRDIVEVSERSFGRNDSRTLYGLVQQISVYLLTSRDNEAERILEDVRQRCKEQGNFDQPYVNAKVVQGAIYMNRGDVRAAEAFLWSALYATLFRYGPRGPQFTHSWVYYLLVNVKQRSTAKSSTSLQPRSGTLCDISEEPIRWLSRPRSSSLSKLDSLVPLAGKPLFSYEAPI